jgi:hypothetical protein
MRLLKLGILISLVVAIGCRQQQSETAEAVVKNKAVVQSKFEAPNDSSEMFANWQKVSGIKWTIDDSNVLAPRGYRAESGPKYGYTTFDGALKHLAKNAKIEITGQTVMRDLDAWKSWDGRTAKIVMAPTRLGREAGVLVLFLSQRQDSEDYSMLGYEVTETDFLAWGGITRMLKMRGVVPSIDAFPKETRVRIARSPFKQQADLYNEALNKQFSVLAKGLMQSMTQRQALLRMQELNYDLILGGDITSPSIGD